jgi:hypothetical protein
MKPIPTLSLLAHAFRHKLKVLLVSQPGLGKSALIELAAEKAEADLVIMHPAVSDPTDFKGMPAVIPGKDRPLAEFLPFGNLRKLIDATSLLVCFIDDIGQAPHAVQAALMQLIHAREVDGQKISDHVVFAGATNDASHMAGVTSILEPVKSRWDTILNLEADVDHWIRWALESGRIAPEIVAFVKFKGLDALCPPFQPSRDLTNSPNPRTVEAASKWVTSGITDQEILTGSTGQGWASEFRGFLKVYQSIDIGDILAHPDTAHVPAESEASLLIALVTALGYQTTRKNIDAVFTYLARLPKDYETLAVRDVIEIRNPKLAETKAYSSWCVRNAKALV